MHEKMALSAILNGFQSGNQTSRSSMKKVVPTYIWFVCMWRGITISTSLNFRRNSNKI